MNYLLSAQAPRTCLQLRLKRGPGCHGNPVAPSTNGGGPASNVSVNILFKTNVSPFLSYCTPGSVASAIAGCNMLQSMLPSFMAVIVFATYNNINWNSWEYRILFNSFYLRIPNYESCTHFLERKIWVKLVRGQHLSTKRFQLGGHFKNWKNNMLKQFIIFFKQSLNKIW